MIGQIAEQGRAHATHAKRQSEEQAGDHSDFARHQFLSVNQDGGEGRRQNHADDHAEDAGPEQVRIGQHQGERQHAEDGAPDDIFAPDAIANGSADDGARRNGARRT